LLGPAEADPRFNPHPNGLVVQPTDSSSE